MCFDLNVLVLNQSKPSKVNFDSSITILNEIEDSEDIARYHSIWPYMVGNKGIWYSLVTPDPEFDGFYLGSEICRTEYECEKKVIIPFGLTDEDIVDCLTPLIINKRFFSDFKRIITYMISQSPVKTIMFLPRYQCADHEIVYGVISINDFFVSLNEKRILFNICYILRGGEIGSNHEI